MKHVCRAACVRDMCKWHTEQEWEEFARSLFALGEGARAAAAGERSANVGAVLMYWMCFAHHGKKHGIVVSAADGEDGGTDMKVATEGGWELAHNLLLQALSDWSAKKKDSDRWCAAVLGAFATRTPELLLRLPWCEQIRSSRNTYVKRMQVQLLSDKVLRPLSPEAWSRSPLPAEFVELCADLLKESIDPTKDTSQSQRQKVRFEALKALTSTLRLGASKFKGRSEAAPQLVTGDAANRVAEHVKKVRDALPGKRGPVYQLCCQALRELKPAGGAASSGGTARSDVEKKAGQEAQSKKRPSQEAVAKVGDTGVKPPEKKHKSEKGAKQFFETM